MDRGPPGYGKEKYTSCLSPTPHSATHQMIGYHSLPINLYSSLARKCFHLSQLACRYRPRSNTLPSAIFPFAVFCDLPFSICHSPLAISPFAIRCLPLTFLHCHFTICHVAIHQVLVAIVTNCLLHGSRSRPSTAFPLPGECVLPPQSPLPMTSNWASAQLCSHPKSVASLPSPLLPPLSAPHLAHSSLPGSPTSLVSPLQSSHDCSTTDPATFVSYTCH